MKKSEIEAGEAVKNMGKRCEKLCTCAPHCGTIYRYCRSFNMQFSHCKMDTETEGVRERDFYVPCYVSFKK